MGDRLARIAEEGAYVTRCQHCFDSITPAQVLGDAGWWRTVAGQCGGLGAVVCDLKTMLPHKPMPVIG